MALTRIASGANHGVRYVEETILGETPMMPTMIDLAYTECSLGLSRDTLTSSTIRSDRQIPFVRTGVDKIAGSVGFELIAKEYDPFLAAALAGEWEDDVLKAGAALRMFSIERAFSDIGQYALFVGCCVNKFSLSVKPGQIITGSFDLVGLSGGYATAPLSPSPTPSQEPVPFDSFTGSIKADNTEIAVITGIDLNLENGVEPKYTLFKRAAVAVGWGKSNLSGTLSAFFTADATLVQKFIADTRISLEFTLTHDEYSYTFLAPNVTLTGADNPVQGENEISLNIPWQASLDAGIGTNIQITRVLPVTP